MQNNEEILMPSLSINEGCRYNSLSKPKNILDFRPKKFSNEKRLKRGANEKLKRFKLYRQKITREPFDFSFEEKNQMSICLDWFKIFGMSNKIPIPEVNENFYSISPELTLQYLGHGTEQFLYLFSVSIYDIDFGTIEFSPRLSKMKNGNFMFKINNELLYTYDWIKVFFEMMEFLNAKLVSISRLDIALDGCNDVPKFLNQYQICSLEGGKTILRKGQPLKSKNAKCKILTGIAQFKDDKKINYGVQSFLIGSPQSEKLIVCYNKTKELEMSNKDYIKAFWKDNGLDLNQENFRLEIRLKAKILAEMKFTEASDLDNENHLRKIISKLNEPSFLASLFETNIKNFFEFYKKNSSNVSRCTHYKLIDFSRFNTVKLERCTKKLSSDNYKAKLSIHLIYKQILKNQLEKDAQNQAKRHASNLIETYKLNDWFQRKITDWIEAYQEKTINTKIRDYLVNQVIRLNLNTVADYFEREDFNWSLELSNCQNLGFNADFETLVKLYKVLSTKIDFILKNRIMNN